MTSKAQPQATKQNINKLDFIKIKDFYASKYTIKKLKRQPIESEKICEKYISDKGLASRMYKEFLTPQP